MRKCDRCGKASGGPLCAACDAWLWANARDPREPLPVGGLGAGALALVILLAVVAARGCA